MNVVVVYEWARDPADALVRADGSVDWRGAKFVPGEDDAAVLAVGRAIGAAGGRDVVGVTIGSGDATWALARGVERAFSVPEIPETADDALTAAILAAVVRHVGDVDVVLVGDAVAYPAVAPTLAGALGWPAVLGVADAGVVSDRLIVTRRVDDREEVLSVATPVVLGVSAASAEKQPPGMKEILAARRRPVVELALSDLDVTPIDRLPERSARPPVSSAARLFTGTPESCAAQLIAALRADGVL